MRSFFLFLLLACFITFLFACKKEHDQDVWKPTPFDFSTIENCDYYMDGNIFTPVYSEVSTPDFNVDPTADIFPYLSLNVMEISAYVWQKKFYYFDNFQGRDIGSVTDWNLPYTRIRDCNKVLTALQAIPVTDDNKTLWNRVRGRALFLRSQHLFNIAQGFAAMYDSSTFTTALGIPLVADFDSTTKRASVKETYQYIIDSVKEAIRLLPATIPPNGKEYPSKPAGYALLARLFLNTRNYQNARLYADSCLQLHNTLIDYNTIDTSSAVMRNYWQSNKEIILSSIQSPDLMDNLKFNSKYVSVDTGLFNLYHANDLRRIVFYRSMGDSIGFKFYDGYSSSFSSFFTGYATDEMYLIRAECAARAGNTGAAIDDLNTLLVTRYKKGTFVPLIASNPNDALQLVLVERRKALAFRGQRWQDLKRLNYEGANITLKRKYQGRDYSLSPGSPSYIFPIPPDIINATHMPQNPR